MKLYKLVYLLPDMSLSDVFRNTEIFTENGLKLAFKKMIEEEQFNTATIDYYDLNRLSDAEIANQSIDFIFDVLKFDGYSFTTVEIGD